MLQNKIMTTTPTYTVPATTTAGKNIKQAACAIIAAIGLAGGVEAAVIGTMMTVGLLTGRIHYGGVAQAEMMIAAITLFVGFLAYFKLSIRAVQLASFFYAACAAFTGASLFAFVVLALKYLP